jgi:hypothetical protein
MKVVVTTEQVYTINIRNLSQITSYNFQIGVNESNGYHRASLYHQH